MKKTYIAPAVYVHHVQTETMIAASITTPESHRAQGT